MMDSTGTMRQLPAKFFKDIPLAENPITGRQQHQQGKPLREAIQNACDAVEPDRSKQGPVFYQDEVVELKGRKFLITKIEPGHLRLKGLPADYMS
jgi:hypothetical protein